MGTYIKSSTGLVRLDQPITSETIKQALGYLPVNFSGNYEDLTNKPIDGGIWTNDSDNFYVVDNNENVIALIDEKGIHSIDFDINGNSVKDHIEDKDIHITAEEREKWNDPLSSDDSELYITDNNGNILALFNSDGLTVSAIKTKTINGIDANDLATRTHINEQIEAINKTLDNIDSILEPVEAEIDALQLTVADIESKTDNIEASENDSTFVITDDAGNAVAQIDESGLTVTAVKTNDINTNNINGTAVNDLTTHITNKANPHEVTAAQVGAYTTTDADSKFAAKEHNHDNVYSKLEHTHNFENTIVSAGLNVDVSNSGLNYTVAVKENINLTSVTADEIIASQISKDDDALVIQDDDGNTIFQVDANGTTTYGIKTNEITATKLNGTEISQFATHSYTEENFATLDHNHNSNYADINHNHDSDYADISHAHDNLYSKLGHTHDLPTVSNGNNIDVTKTNLDYKVALANEIELTKVKATTVSADILETPTVLQDGDTFVVQDLNGNAIAQIDDSGLTVTAVKTNIINDINANDLATKTELGGKVQELQSAITSGDSAVNSQLTTHTTNKANPHGVTAAQIGVYTITDANNTFAAKGHGHDGVYAASGHNHDSDYADINHSHNGVYAEFEHNHDGVYSKLGHNHDSDYADIDHNHDSDYADINHNHDTIYSKLDHSHDLPTVSEGANITVTKTDLDYNVALDSEIELAKVTADTVITDVLETPTVLQDGDNLSVSDVNGNIVAQIGEDGLSTIGVNVNGKDVALKEDILLYDDTDTNGNICFAQPDKYHYIASERYFKVEYKDNGLKTYTDIDNIFIKSDSLIASDMESGAIKVLATKNDTFTGENAREWIDPATELVVKSANTAINADTATNAETANHAIELQDSWRLCKRYVPGDTDYSFDLPEGVYMFMWRFYDAAQTNSIFTDILALRIGDFGYNVDGIYAKPKGTSHQISCSSYDADERVFANLTASPNSSLRTFTINIELFDKNGVSHTDIAALKEIYFKPISNINIFEMPTHLTCSTCIGTGKTISNCSVCNGTNICSVCDGTGSEACPHCGGDGAYSAECTHCNGAGDCGECQGRGYVATSVCSTCRGMNVSWLCNACGYNFTWKDVDGGFTCKCGAYYANSEAAGRQCQIMGCPACSTSELPGYQVDTCPSCSGSEKCIYCGGDGVLSGNCPYCSATGQITCRTCDGAKTCQECTQGKVYSTCTTCGGDGTI